jgi:hypothetical protein
MKRTGFFLVVLLALAVSGTVMAVEIKDFHELKIIIPEIIELSIDTHDIVFDDILVAGVPWIRNAVTVHYKCNKNIGWELRAEATEFRSPDSVLPVEELKIVIGDVVFGNLLSGQVVIDDSSRYAFEDRPTKKILDAGYGVVISPSELDAAFEGEYTSTVTYTLFVP